MLAVWVAHCSLPSWHDECKVFARDAHLFDSVVDASWSLYRLAVAVRLRWRGIQHRRRRLRWGFGRGWLDGGQHECWWLRGDRRFDEWRRLDWHRGRRRLRDGNAQVRRHDANPGRLLSTRLRSARSVHPRRIRRRAARHVAMHDQLRAVRAHRLRARTLFRGLVLPARSQLRLGRYNVCVEHLRREWFQLRPSGV